MTTETSTARVVQVNINPKGGVPKRAVPSAQLTTGGVAGDKQRDRRFHGGPTRAVSLYSAELIDALRAEGHSIAPGSTGENLTISGLPWDALLIGDRLRIGDAVLIEITGYASPCNNIAESFEDHAFKRVSQRVNPGWSRLYARVLHEGEVRVGDGVAHEVGG